VLHGVIRDHVDDFLRAAADRADGTGLPEFIAREFREFLTCGVLAHGFARVRCECCAFERLLPFSCKGRGFCPSCGGRRMTERAAHLVDKVIPFVPVRQWVLTLPYRLRYLLAWDHGLSRAVLAIHARALLDFYRQQAQRQGIPAGRTGTVTAVQRFGGGLNLNVHFHTLALDGVFVRSLAGRLAFHPACGPSDAEVAQVLGTIRRRVGRLLRRHGLEPDADGPGREDPLAETSLALAGIVGASVQGRVALGARAGAPVRRLGDGVRHACGGARGPRHAHLEGFDLHANVWVGPNDRARLELKRPWSDGTTHLLFEPVEFLEKLAAVTPRPEINLVLYHGVLAPHARWRAEVVAYRRADIGSAQDPSAAVAEAGRGRPGSPRSWTWAALMRRAFDLDVLRCPRCAGRMQLIATIEDPAVIQRILAHLGLPGTREGPQPAWSKMEPGAEQLALPGLTV
jgi:hypothetical protein